MKIKVRDGKTTKEMRIDTNMTIADLSKKMSIMLSEHIIRVNNEIVPDNEKLRDGDVIEFMKVISGG